MNKAKAGYIEGLVSVVVNVFLFALKLWAGMVSGSLAITADAWHTLSDSFSSLIVIGAVKLSGKKADKDHPFGHGRWEQIAALVIGFILALIAYDFLKNAIEQFSRREVASFGLIAIWVTTVSVIVKEALAQYAFFIWRKTGNLTVKADGWHHRTDAFSSLVLLIGILFANNYWWIDAALGAMISLLLFYAAWQIFRDATHKLLGEVPDARLIKSIESEISKVYDKPFYPHHFHIHNYVAHKELTFHIKLNGNLSVSESHHIASLMEKTILDKFEIVATIHVEPGDS